MNRQLRETMRSAEVGERKPLRVLCADDDEQIGAILEMALERAGYFVECVHDGQMAFERITADLKFFDLLVTDHRMPHLSGLQLVERLRHAGFSGKIVVHTSHLQHRETSAYRALAVHAFLTKPVTLPELLTAVQQAGDSAP